MTDFITVIKTTGLFPILRSIFYNFRYLPHSQAVRLPIIVGKKTKIFGEGILKIDSIKIELAMIKIGVNCGNAIDKRNTTTVNIMGKIIFEGKADIWKDTKVLVLPKGSFKIGEDFLITGRSSFKIYRNISIGKDCLFSSDIMVMDYDGHKIYNEMRNRINDHKPIKIGNHVWIGARSSIWSGAVIPNNCIIGLGAFISKELPFENTIYVTDGGVIKKNIHWEK